MRNAQIQACTARTITVPNATTPPIALRRAITHPKSRRSGGLTIPSIFRGYLVEHRERRFALGQRTGFVFGASAESPFNYDVTYGRYGFGRRPGSSRSACTSADTPTSR
jgi:hypothetical protein